MANRLKEKLVLEKRGRRYALVRSSKVGRVIEIRTTLSTHKTQLDATIKMREIGEV